MKNGIDDSEAVAAGTEENSGLECAMEHAGISYVRRGKYDRIMKHMMKRMRKQNQKLSPKEQAKAEKVGRGYEKIFKLIDRGIANVSNT